MTKGIIKYSLLIAVFLVCLSCNTKNKFVITDLNNRIIPKEKQQQDYSMGFGKKGDTLMVNDDGVVIYYKTKKNEN